MVALRLVRDIVTGLSKRYAFIEYETSKMALNAYIRCKSLIIKNSRLYVDYECGRILPGWKPRRLGIIKINVVTDKLSCSEYVLKKFMCILN